MKRHHYVWFPMLFIVGVFIAPRVIAAMYGNVGSVLFLQDKTKRQQELLSQVLYYYQTSDALWSNSQSAFRLVRVNYLISGNSVSKANEVDASRFLELAGGYLQKELWEDAQFWAEQALIAEESSDAYYYLGQIARVEGNLNLALDYYVQAWEISQFIYPINRLQCAYNLTWIYYYEQNWRRGDNWLETYKSLLGDKLSLQDWRELGRLNLVGGRDEKTQKLLDYAIHKNSNDPWVYASFIELYWQEGVPTAALSICKSIPADIQHTQPVLHQCGKVFYELKLWELTAATYRELTYQNPHNAWAYYRLANTYVHLDDTDQVLFYLDQAYRYAPEDLSVALAVGRLYEQLGYPDMALEVYQSLLNHYPKNNELKEAITQLEN